MPDGGPRQVLVLRLTPIASGRTSSPARGALAHHGFWRATIRHTMNVPQREFWGGHPVELGDAWVLSKGDKTARRILVSHQLGWEPRSMTPELLHPQVCRSPDDILSTHEEWKAAMIEKGGSDDHTDNLVPHAG